MAEVFINYREDSQSSASRLARELKEKIDTQSVFIEQTGNGVRSWNQQAEEQIIQCKVFVVVIGKQWHLCQNPDTGIRRISDPDDVVRQEIELALQHHKPIIVIFVDGVTKGAIKKSFANDEGIKHLQVIFDAKHFPLDQEVIPYTYNLDLEKIVRAIEEIIIPPDHIPYETAIALLKDSVKWLILLRQRKDVVLYRIQTAHIWDLLLDSDIPIELKRRFIPYISVHLDLFLCLNILRVDNKWDPILAEGLRDLAVKIGEFEAEIDRNGRAKINKNLIEILDLNNPQNRQMKDRLQSSISFAIPLKLVPVMALKPLGAAAFSVVVRALNAHKTSIQPVDEDINKVTAEELLERIIQVEAELERIAAG